MARRTATEPLDLVDEVAQTREAVRTRARSTLGITGDDTQAPPLREAIRPAGVGLYPLVALGVLSIVDSFQSYAFRVLAPEISRALGIGKGAVSGVLTVYFLAAALSPLVMSALVQRKPRRAVLCIVTAFAWAAATLCTGFVTSTFGLAVVLIADGFSTGSVNALHVPLVMDTYPPQARVRAVSYYRAADSFGSILAPLLVALLTGYFAFNWRGVFFVLGLTCVLATLATLRLRDPGFGRFDTRELREQVHAFHGEVDATVADDVSLGFFEIVRRLLMIPTIKRFLFAMAILGVFAVPFRTFLFFFLEERWGFSPAQRGFFYAYLSAASIVTLATLGRRGESVFRQDPAKLVEYGGVSFIASVALICAAAVSPWLWLMILLFGLSSASLVVMNVILVIAPLSIVPAQMRPHLSALIGIFQAGVGGVVGSVFLSGIDARFGIAGSMVALAVPGVIGALVIRSTAQLVNPDLDRMIDAIVEEEEINRITTSGGHLPMLACRNVDFSYGQLQVLFGVDFTVDDGEMVALLGTNGAGKSTLLKVISGIGLPSNGTVRYRGSDITFLDAERRLLLGITQVPGGRAVFGSMSVVDNLRTFGTTLAHDKRALDAAIDRCFVAFPRLAERRNASASTLSGGEQQMLGLSKALILRPRLLLIDELSLGLAPVVVAQLLDMVREINADGTAVVLVEQSVNIALGLVDHAYFMEKGEMRFDGASRDLLARDDLLRAVFLEGATKGSTQR